jgi:hypothetical protein
MNAGDEITIPAGKLNESMLHNFQVLDENNSPITFDDGYADPCDKFSLKTYINQDIECETSCDDEDEEESEYY